MSEKIVNLSQLEAVATAAKNQAQSNISELASTTTAAIEEMNSVKQDKITGFPGQVVVINSSGKAVGENLQNLIKPQLIVTVDIGAEVTVKDSGRTFKQTATSTSLAFELTKNSIYRVTVSATLNGATSNTVTFVANEVKVYTAALRFYHIYGVEWDGVSSDGALTRTDDSAEFIDPVPYISGASSYSSPFDNLQPWAGMVKKERTGGTMVAIPKFWYRLEETGYGNYKGFKIKIADKEVPGFYVSPAHMSRGDDRGERDVVYIARYHCSDTYKSETGKMPKVNIERSEARTAIHNLGANIWQSDFAMRFTIWLLYLVEFAHFDSQAKIGFGCGNYSDGIGAMGYTDSMPYHTGTTMSYRGGSGLGTQYRNIEGLWDNVLDWMDGCYSAHVYDGDSFNIIMNPADFSETKNGVFVGCPGVAYDAAIYEVSTLGGFPLLISSDKREGSVGDGWILRGDNFPCLQVGGNCGCLEEAGLFYIVGNNGCSDYCGCRLQELP